MQRAYHHLFTEFTDQIVLRLSSFDVEKCRKYEGTHMCLIVYSVGYDPAAHF